MLLNETVLVVRAAAERLFGLRGLVAGRGDTEGYGTPLVVGFFLVGEAACALRSCIPHTHDTHDTHEVAHGWLTTDTMLSIKYTVTMNTTYD